MNDKTKNLEDAFKYIRTFYNETAKMLSDIITLMGDKGWESSSGSSITADLSYSLENPNQWMASYIYKNFEINKGDSQQKGVFILFSEKANGLPICIICGRISELPKSCDKWWLYYLIFNNKKEFKDLSDKVIHLKTEYNNDTIEGDVFVIPLSDINSSDDVKYKVVERLLVL